MKRVLVLAYYFPPLGGAGVQRTVKFVNHLPELGFETTVVTGPEGYAPHWAPRDRALEAEVPDDLRVLRARGIPRQGAGARAARWLGITSPFERWWRHEALRLGRSVVRDVDLVYASLSPFGTASVATALAAEADVPSILDLRDPWALDEWAVYPTAVHRALDRRRMRHALRASQAVIANCPEAARELVARFPELASARVATIANGWDRDDFTGNVAPRDDGRVRIVYAGYSHIGTARSRGALGVFRKLAGGSTRGLETLPRSHFFLLHALQHVCAADPELRGRFEVHIAGAARAVDATPSEAIRVVRHGYLPHDAAVDLMRSSDALFLALHDLPTRRRALTVPGKTYEYLATGKPIIAALPDGDARDLLATMPGVWLCRPRDVRAIESAVLEVAELGEGSEFRRDVDRFERRTLAAELAALFGEVLAAAGKR